MVRSQFANERKELWQGKVKVKPPVRRVGGRTGREREGERRAQANQFKTDKGCTLYSMYGAAVGGPGGWEEMVGMGEFISSSSEFHAGGSDIELHGVCAHLLTPDRRPCVWLCGGRLRVV